MSANKDSVSFEGDENVLKSVSVSIPKSISLYTCKREKCMARELQLRADANKKGIVSDNIDKYG